MFKLSSVLSTVVSIIVGLMFLVIGLVFFLKYDPDAYDTPGTGTIVEIDEHYESIGGENELQHTVYIDYSAGGQKYEHVEFMEYKSRMAVGDQVEFYYMSSDPTQLAGPGKENTPYFGLAFAVIGAGMLVFTVLRTVRRRLA